MRLAKYANLLLSIFGGLLGAVTIEAFLRFNDASSTSDELVDIVLDGRTYEL